MYNYLTITLTITYDEWSRRYIVRLPLKLVFARNPRLEMDHLTKRPPPVGWTDLIGRVTENVIRPGQLDRLVCYLLTIGFRQNLKCSEISFEQIE